MCKAILSKIEARKVKKLLILSILHVSIFLQFSSFQFSIGISTVSIDILTGQGCQFAANEMTIDSYKMPNSQKLTPTKYKSLRILTPPKCSILHYKVFNFKSLFFAQEGFAYNETYQECLGHLVASYENNLHQHNMIPLNIMYILQSGFYGDLYENVPLTFILASMTLIFSGIIQNRHF